MQPRSTCASIESLQTRILFNIKLDLVALHEFGHSLGLAHYADTPANSIMEAYYNPNYNKANLASDVAVTVNSGDGFSSLMERFSDANVAANSTAWKDSLDDNPGNGTVDVSYSFMPDGSKLDSNKRNVLFTTMNSAFGSPAAWQALLAAELNRWASVSDNNLSFSFNTDNGANFGASGAVQNDPRFGDIRIGAHRFDGKGGTLAHAYYPPPNSGTAAGDAHFASEETWISNTARGSFIELEDGRFFCTAGEEMDHHDHELTSDQPITPVALANPLANTFIERTDTSANRSVDLDESSDSESLIA